MKGWNLKVGIFGKSGSGKTTVADFFEEKGFLHIDLDKIGKSVVEKYPEVLKKISIIFGNGFVENGVLNRKKLGSLVFSDPKKLEKLNKIFFEYIKLEALEIIKLHENCVVEGAILIDIGLNANMDHIIYVKTPDELAVKRLLSRDYLNESETKNRLGSQSKYDEQSKMADFIIHTDDSTEVLHENISKIFKQLNL